MDHLPSTNEICRNTLGVAPEQICSTVLLTPGWSPERLFAPQALHTLTESSPLHGYKLWNVDCGSKRCTYLRTGFGAPMVLDAVLLLRHTPCKRILFVSSAGALGSRMRVGDLLLPAASYNGDGASRYLQNTLTNDCFCEEQLPDQALFDRLCRTTEHICLQQDVAWHIGRTFCVDTIAGQAEHIPCIRSMGYDSLDMESAVLFKAARRVGIAAAAILLISDTQEKPLTEGRNELSALYRKRVRSATLPAILHELL